MGSFCTRLSRSNSIVARLAASYAGQSGRPAVLGLPVRAKASQLSDIVANALGLENVWLGRYRRANGALVEGPSLRDLVAARDPEIAEQTTRDLAQALEAARAIHAPFDQEILGGDEAPGRQRIRAVIDSLKRTSQDLVKGAYVIGITRLTLAEPKPR